MTREETIQLLETLAATYPNAKIKDAAKMADMWQMALEDFTAEAVYKAARLHMNSNKFFPTPADIKEKLARAELIYQGPPLNAIEPPKNAKDDYYLEELCRFVGLGYDEPDDNADLTKDFMNWER